MQLALDTLNSVLIGIWLLEGAGSFGAVAGEARVGESRHMRRFLSVLYVIFVGVPLLLLTIPVGIYYDLCKKMRESE